jgi:WD40 repeat protein
VLDTQRFVLPQRALTKAETEERRNLLILLNKVRTFWITGVLEASLHDVAMLELGKELKMEAIDRWMMTLERDDQPDVILSSGQQVVDIFDQLGGTLLILGAPGSGKTFALLELARDLLNRAEQNAGQPIPTIFNLSSWQDPNQSLADWMAEELSTKYQIPRKIGRRWIAENKILPLLDGLDEVRLNSQTLCVQAINAFREDHRLTGVAVCSRTEAYERLKNEHNVRLRLEGAILLQPLSPRQIDDYLQAAGPQLAAVRDALQYDHTLQTLAETPLMLNVMSLAYQGKSVETLHSFGTVEERRQHLFAEYVERMFGRIVRTKQDLYPKEQMIDWLRWLAQRMDQHHQSVFLMEQLQPSWLSTRAQRWLYLLSTRLIGGLVIILSLFGPITALLAGVGNSAIVLPLVLLIGWLGAGTATALILGLRFEWLDRDVRPKTPPSWDGWRRGASVVFIGTGVALAFIFACALVFGLSELISSMQFEAWLDQEKSTSEWLEPLANIVLSLIFGLGASLIAGLVFGLVFGLRGSRQGMSGDIQAVETLNWSWPRFLVPLTGIGLLIGGLTFVSSSLAIMDDSGFKLWDENGGLITALEGHSQPATMVDFDAESTRMVTASEDGTVQLWDADGHYITGLAGHAGAVGTAKFNPSGSQILTADGDGTVRLWDGQDGRLMTAFKGHKAWIASVRFNADGTLTATMGCDESDAVCEVRTARLWDEAGNPIAVLGEKPPWVTEIAFTPDAKSIATGEKAGTARLWDRDGNLLATFPGQPGDGVVSSVSFNADGTRMVTITSEGTSYLWGIEGELMSALSGQTEPITPSVPIAGEARILRDVQGGTMRLWDEDGNLIANLKGYAQPVTRNGFNLNTTRILTIVDDGSMRLWDRDGALIASLEGHAKQVTCGSFNPDHTRIVTGGEDGSVRLWDSRNGQLVATLDAHRAPVTSATYSPDGKRLLTTSVVTDNRPYAALWLLLGSVIGLSRGLRTGVRETKDSPNQGIRLSARNALLVGLVGMLVGVLVGVLGSVLFRGSESTGLFIGLILGLALGTLAALWYGGLDVIQHYVLRLILWRGTDHIPWDYSRALDYAAERILLQKVGGSYQFKHRLLQTYFSELGRRSARSSGG